MSAITDRIVEIDLQNRVTGIDFIYVHPDQRTLDIFFLRKVMDLIGSPKLPAKLKAADIKIYSAESALPVIEVEAILGWLLPATGPHVLKIKTKQPGDFSLYRLLINDNRLDSYFNDVSFSFKANCPSDLDCKPPAHECPPEELVDFPIDYLARDFWSYREALLDFASLRYPDWADRLEADAGVMMAELMSALGDEMSYYQDRVSREAYLETATQRRSVRRHARLIDYQMHDGLGATGWLDVEVDATVPSGAAPIPAGASVFALSDDNTSIDFEIGKGLAESITNSVVYNVDASNNEFKPHIWDDNDKCLLVGSTELYINGRHSISFAGLGGKWVLLKTNPTDPAQPERTQLVRIISAIDTMDLVLNVPITHLVWEEEQAIQFEFDLSILSVRANIVPITAGKTYETYFIVDSSLLTLSSAAINAFSPLSVGKVVYRGGHDNTPVHLFTLPNSETMPLVYSGDFTDEFNQPEIFIEEVIFNGSVWAPPIPSQPWLYRNSLVGVHSSAPSEKHFTLDDGSWQRVVGYQRIGKEIEHRDYAMNEGVTIRFGDGEFGRVPNKGTVFKVSYRLGGTRRSNISARSITNFSTAISGLSISNPLPTTGGRDAESPIELKQKATEAFRAVTFRAVRPEDYAEAAERLPWVQKAGSVFRWTGSWLTAFVTPDPKGTVSLERPNRTELMEQLNRFRQAGREVNVMDPIYASIDLEIEICVSPNAYPGQVKERILEALMGKKGIRPKSGYFGPDRYTFGTVLDRSTLEAAIQNVQGVRAIEKIRFRRKGWFPMQTFSELRYDPGKNSIIRITNDPLRPDEGTLKLYTHGGL